MKEKIVLGLSGGVDSAVAARLLQERYEVTGLYLDIGLGGTGAADAAAVAERLGIPFETADIRAELEREVCAPFAADYRAGRTPLPCARCNPAVKFPALFALAGRIGAHHNKFMLLLSEILENLSRLAEKTKHMVMPGRTHGRHAIPITYGYKVAVWISDFIDCSQRMKECEKRVFTIMMGGAVGAFNTMPGIGLEVQKRVAELTGMHAMEVPSRNLSTHKLEYMANLALMANICHKIGEEVYSTTLEEIAEVSEGFTKGTVGSSTMPHKINPKLAKGIIANSQKLYSLPGVGMYSAVRPYEGDSSSYMLFDGLIEEALELTTEVLLRTEELTRTIVPHEERMLHNVMRNKGLDNTEYVMMKMAEKLGKDKAHSLLYEEAIKTAADGEDFYTNLTKNDTITAAFSNEEIKAMLDPRAYIGLSVEIAEKEAKRGSDAAQKIKKDYQ